MLRPLDFILLTAGEPLDVFKWEETSKFVLKNIILVLEWKMNFEVYKTRGRVAVVTMLNKVGLNGMDLKGDWIWGLGLSKRDRHSLIMCLRERGEWNDS